MPLIRTGDIKTPRQKLTDEELRRRQLMDSGIKAGDVFEPLGKKSTLSSLSGQTSPLADPVKRPDLLPGTETFERALLELKGSKEVRPEVREALETIGKETEIDRARRISEAKALQEQRGTEGSSIEAFQTQLAASEAERIGAQRKLPFLQSSIEQEQRLQVQRGGALESRAGQEIGFETFFEGLNNSNKQVLANLGSSERQLIATLKSSDQQLLANLKSDELASIRNLMETGKDRELQLKLGELGISVSRDQIEASKSIAKKEGKTRIIEAGIGAVGGVVSGLFPF